MSYNLFLDDERQPRQVTWVKIPDVAWTVVRNYYEFILTIDKSGRPAFVSFDHDLADEHYHEMLKDCQKNNNGKLLFELSDTIQDHDYGQEKTGLDCAKFLVDYCIEHSYKFPEYSVHSMNPVGSERIRQYIEWAKTKVNTL